MFDYNLNEIRRGWISAAAAPGMGPLFGGHAMPDVDILVDDESTLTAPTAREPLGDPAMVWVTPRSLRSGPFGSAAVVTSKSEFSGANRHRRGTMRTMAMFHKFRNDSMKLEDAALLAALVGLRNVRPDLVLPTASAVRTLLRSLDFACLQDIWARSNSAPMPVPLPTNIRQFPFTRNSAEDLGEMLRLWHSISFRRLVAVVATPVRAGLAPLSLSTFDEVNDRYCEGLNEAHGKLDWKTLEAPALERMVWENPRSHLVQKLGVSDVAISKRCRRENISYPPRGYWQRLEAEIDPRPLLDRSDIVPPVFVSRDLAQRFEVCEV